MGSGRELSESYSIKEALVEVGVNLTGFDAFMMDGGGGQQIASGHKVLHATGFVGTPHYVFTIIKEIDTGYLVENTALIRSKLEQGLARNEHIKAEFSHVRRGPAKD